MSWASQVYFAGIIPPSLNAGLVMIIFLPPFFAACGSIRGTAARTRTRTLIKKNDRLDEIMLTTSFRVSLFSFKHLL